MARNYGPDVSYTPEDLGYNYDMVIFQKQKPPLDSELNLVQQLQLNMDQRRISYLPSGWVSLYPISTNSALTNSFYMQSLTNPRPEIALVNGMAVHVTNTGTTTDNLNIINLGAPPTTGNQVNGVFLEVWRSLLDPDTSTNKPSPESVIDSLKAIYMANENNGWIVGEHGLILNTQNGGQTWITEAVDSKYNLNGVHFITSSIGWVVGDSGFIARTSSGGATWTSLTSVTIENLNSVFAVSQLVVWAVGMNGTVLKTANGVSWTTYSLGVTTNLRKVYFYNSLVGWIVGDSGTILKTNNGGTTWSSQLSGTTANLNSIFFYDENYGFAVGDGGTILRTSDGGSSWVDQSGNIYTGSGYTRLTQNLRDVHMVPAMDRLVTNEEVSSQLDGTNKNFTTMHSPITVGNGKGTITNTPSDITVTVNGSPAAVDTINGTTGTVVLATAPGLTDTVKVTYYYRAECAVFTGKAWIAGDSGKVLYTSDIGANWVEQTSQTSYNLNSVRFVDESKGWVVGSLSVIRNTENSGTTWTTQLSQAIIRQMQRVFYEGNIGGSSYLEENTLHPDANVETTKRIQIQYKIRVVENVDPISNPEAGLSISTTGLGPNSTGSFGYENMGLVNGDYGCWRSRCLNTVDGYVYAIPMFFVSRRNTSAYNSVSNPNGAHQINSDNVRPDRLYATEIASIDILDARRRIIASNPSELLTKYFDALCRNELKEKLAKPLTGSVRYGTELLQVDRIKGLSSHGGDAISGDLTDAVNGNIDSGSSIETVTLHVSASATSPANQPVGPVTGIFYPDVSRYRAIYISTNPVYSNKTIPGYFEKISDNELLFVFSSNTNTTVSDPNLSEYRITADWISPSTDGLTFIPSTPKLTKNVSAVGSPAFFYQGVLNDSVGDVLEIWGSGVSGYSNYVKIYPAKDSDDSSQQIRPSTVETHYYKLLTASDISGSNTVLIDTTIYPITGDVPYTIFSVSKINNVTSGFSYKIIDMKIGTVSGKLEIQSASGFPFISGTLIEVVGYALSSFGSANTRNGASVNFTRTTKEISDFCKSDIISETGGASNTIILSATGANILGISSAETIYGLTQHVCWVNQSGTDYLASISSVTGLGTGSVTLVLDKYLHNNSTITTLSGFTVKIQSLLDQTVLPYPDGDDGDGLLIGYNHIPYQSMSGLPETLKVEIAAKSESVSISNMGTGGGNPGDPYSSPILHIPFNDTDIPGDSFFSNIEPLAFMNISADGGYINMPAYMPASIGSDLTFSTITFDILNRYYYKACSREFKFVTEGLQRGLPRKVYVPVIARVLESSDSKILVGEYIMVVFSMTFTTETENYTGYETSSHSVIAVYRLPNKPLTRN